MTKVALSDFRVGHDDGYESLKFFRNWNASFAVS